MLFIIIIWSTKSEMIILSLMHNEQEADNVVLL